MSTFPVAASPSPFPGHGKAFVESSVDDETPAKWNALNPTEAKLADIWCTALGIPEVGPEGDFFAIGGDSLLMARVVGRIRRTWLIEITLKDLIERPVLADLAQWIDERIEQRVDQKATSVPE